MKYHVVPSKRFQKELKRAALRGLPIQRIKEVIEILAQGGTLEAKYRDHALEGNYAHCRECHIQPDWLLIYRYYENELILSLIRTGSHSDLF